VIEDAPAGIKAARAGGMRAIAVTFIGHHDSAVLEQAGADLIVASLEAVSSQVVGAVLRGR
jgi:beta-phosphoglucomutase